jgi:hypothetical protein
MMATEEIEIQITADTGKAVAALTKVETAINKTGNAAKKADKSTKDFSSVLQTGAAKFALFTGAIVGTVAAFRDVVGESIKAQKIQQQLNATIKSTGGVAGVTASQVNKLAKEFSSVTTFEDDAIVAAQGTILTFTSIGKDIFPRVTAATLDMSTAMGTDLQTAAFQLGKALNDPAEGMTSLVKMGIRLSEEQKKQINAFTAMNDVASAQAIILKEVETRFGGSATAAAEGVGVYDIMNNKFGDVKETIGDAINSALIPLAKILIGAIDLFQKLPNVLQGTIGAIALLIPAVIALGVAFGPVGVVIGLAGAAVAAFTVATTAAIDEAEKLAAVKISFAIEDLQKSLEKLDTEAAIKKVKDLMKATKDEGLAAQAFAFRVQGKERDDLMKTYHEKAALYNGYVGVLKSLQAKKNMSEAAAEEAARKRELAMANAFYKNDLTLRLEAARKANKELLNSGAANPEQKARAARELAAIENDVYAEAAKLGIEIGKGKEEALTDITKNELDKRRQLQQEMYSSIEKLATSAFSVLGALSDANLENELKNINDERNARLLAFEASSAGVNEATARLEEIRQAELVENKDKLEQEKNDAIAAGDAALAAEKAREIEKINLGEQEKARAAEIQAAKDAINAEADAKERAAKKKGAEEQKALAIVQSIISTAVGIGNALQAPPFLWPLTIATAAITGAAQTALIASQPIPAFADGGIVSRPTLAQVGEGGSPEAIIPLKNGAVPVSFDGGSMGGDFQGAIINVYPQSFDSFISNMNKYKRTRG